MKGKHKSIHLLLAEDDSNLGFVIQDSLMKKGFQVTLCTDGEEALKTFVDKQFDLCILDVMMPKKSGFEVAETVREINGEVPIVFLTAKSMQEDKLNGFMLGADDYVTKPFDFEELVYRVEAILKRGKILNKAQKKDAEQHQIGRYLFDVNNQQLQLDGEKKKLTQKETKILAFLCTHKNTTVSRDKILKNVWGTDDYFSGRSMDVFISKLRKYLSDDAAIKIINVHGVGFKLEVQH